MEGLSNGKVVSLTKKEYFFVVHFLQIFIESFKSMSDEWFIAICWRSFLFKTFIIKNCAIFIISSFGALNYDCVIKTMKILSFLSLINSSVTIGFSFFY